MSAWVDIKFAPKDGTLVDLWCSDRDPDPKAAGIMLPIQWRRVTDCFYGSPISKVHTSELLMPLPAAWYRADTYLGVRSDGVWHYHRLWPTHYMLPPEPPVKP